MKLEDQVCSLELAKKLKELGVKSPSVFIYDGPTTELSEQEMPAYYEDGFNAYTVAELGEIILENDSKEDFWTYPNAGKVLIKQSFGEVFEADTEADARAKMLIHLIEKGILKPEGGG